MERRPFTKEKISGIYTITNIVNGKVYVGQSIDCHNRWYQHFYSAFNYNSQHHLHKALRKYGFNNFKFEVIKETYDLDYWEKFFIKIFNSQNPSFGYNYQPGGNGGWCYLNNQIRLGQVAHPMTGHVWTEQQLLNMSNGRKGKYCGESHYLSKMTSEERKTFIKTRCGTLTAPWWNNGKEQRRSFEQPGPEWVRGQCIKNSSWGQSKGTKWFNNGVKNVRSTVCPEGFVPGRLMTPRKP